MKSLQTLFAFNYARFFSEGTAFTVPSAGTADANNLPGATDNGWVDLPNVTAFDPSTTDDIVYKKKRPVVTPGGVKILHERNIRAGETFQFKITCDELSPLVLQAFYRTQALNESSTQGNLSAGNPPIGWLKLQQMDQEGDVLMESDFYVELTVSGGMNATFENPVKPEFTVTVLYSPLASMGF